MADDSAALTALCSIPTELVLIDVNGDTLGLIDTLRDGDAALSAVAHDTPAVVLTSKVDDVLLGPENGAAALSRGRRTPAARSAEGYAHAMPMPKRSSVDDFFAQLNDVQRPHLEALRELSRDADPEAREELKWNLPVYVRGKNTSLWMLQNFKNHCSLRFPPPFFATQMAAVEAAGYEAGKGFIKLPYERELPTELLNALLQARVEEYAATGAGWNDR
ncbi:MAG: DUF1801 domain-containing protein [Solirubrobacteraceae bacterium]